MSTYLDWAATALPDETIYREALEASLNHPGNPSAQHSMGAEAKEQLEEDRKRCAARLGCPAERLFFTSGGSESNNIVLLSRLNDRKPGQIIISSLEHASLSEPVELLKKQGHKIKILTPDERGIIPPQKLARALNEETRLVSLIAVHNETGVRQPIKELVAELRAFEQREGVRTIQFHSDMVQAPGKMTLNLEELGVDSASFSAHKIRGPKQSGLLYLKKDMAVFYRGGGQERGIRPGTESLFNSRSMALSLEKWGSEAWKGETAELLLKELSQIKGLLLNPAARLTEQELYAPAIVNFSLAPLPGEVLQRVLNEQGFCISTGSACSSNKKSQTGGLISMGIDKSRAHCSVRVSLGPATTKEEILSFIDCLKGIQSQYAF
ncbi:MAG: cysteine desulfurase family protein [Spirochaetales bacterium]|nr:cysteine desulfurase family protein [Spirochaetales bacterium]